MEMNIDFIFIQLNYRFSFYLLFMILFIICYGGKIQFNYSFIFVYYEMKVYSVFRNKVLL